MNINNFTGASSILTSTPNAKDSGLKRPRLGSNGCPMCSKALNKNGTESVLCSICELGYCVDCTNIPKSVIEVLKQQDGDSLNFMWTCNGCKQNFPSLTGMKKQLKAIEETTKTKLAHIEDQMGAIGPAIKTQVKEEITNVTPVLIETIKSEIKGSLQDDVRKEIREIEDQKIRAMNLILFNVQESKQTDSAKRKDDDIKSIKELCTYLKIDSPDLKSVFRLGNRSENKTRPLKMILNNKKERKNILDNANKLKHIPSTHKLEKMRDLKELNTTTKGRTKEKIARI